MITNSTNSPSWQRYLSINTYDDLNNLVEDAMCEDLYLECKDQTSPTQISQPVLAKTLSGFSNTSGGVLIWGAQTDKKNGNDVITQLMPIGNVDTFLKRIANMIPTLTVPSITNVEFKVIKCKATDTKGYVVAHIPQLAGQPTQSTKDNYFYIRAGDQFTVASYEFIQRMFAAQDAPNIELIIPSEFLKFNEIDGKYHIPICLTNKSFAVGREVVCTVEVKDYKDFSSVTCDTGLRDISEFNKDKKLFTAMLDRVLHRGFPTMLGDVLIKPLRSKIALIEVVIFADRMVANVFLFKIYLYKKGPKYELVSQTLKY